MTGVAHGDGQGRVSRHGRHHCKATNLIEVIAFDSTAQRYVKMQHARYRARIQTTSRAFSPGEARRFFRRSTWLTRDISVVQARTKHVILLPDGQRTGAGHQGPGERDD